MNTRGPHGSVQGLVFVGCMFLGGGLGLVFKRPDVGGALGMGVGFLLMALLKLSGGPTASVAIIMPSTTIGYLVLLLGLALIVTGLGVLYFPNLLHDYGAGLLLTLCGVVLARCGIKVARQRP